MNRVLIFDKAEKYLVSRNLVSQYKKAKEKILSGDLKSVDFKLRRPKKEEIYQFRLTKKYRTFRYC